MNNATLFTLFWLCSIMDTRDILALQHYRCWIHLSLSFVGNHPKSLLDFQVFLPQIVGEATTFDRSNVDQANACVKDTVGPVNIQTSASDFWGRQIKHGLAYPRNISSARMFGGPRVAHMQLCPPWVVLACCSKQLRDT
jgi:hypothetical protein